MPARKPRDPATDYAKKVLAGKIVAGRWIRLACERHLRDLKDGPKRGLRWDLEAADHAYHFFDFVRLPHDGSLDGQPFILRPFQYFKTGSIFGWKTADNIRRFRTAYIEESKGSGKTPWAAATGLYGLTSDREAAAEIYSGATSREQAAIMFQDAKRMAEASPALRSRLKIDERNIACLATGSFFRPVSSEHRGLDGKRPHMGLLDEIHEHPNSLVVDKMRAGTKSRRQALIIEITNSGYDRQSVCWAHHEYSLKILKRQLDYDAWFAFICGLDPCAKCLAAGHDQPKDGCGDCDQYTDERVWEKANPGLDTILPRQYLREQVAEAQGMPSKEGIVRRLNFCIWTQGATRAIAQDAWDKCGLVPVPELQGLECFGGMDLASTTDVAAFVLSFPLDGKIALRPHFWIPEDNIRRRVDRDHVPYDLWHRQGSLTLTPGNVIDYDRIRSDINELGKLYNIREIACDRWNATQISTQLAGDGFEVVGFGQGFKDMNAPTKEIIKLVASGDLVHGNHPVMNWMAGNLCTEEDAAGNLKPSKERSIEKIDGLVAAIMGIGRYLVAEGGDSGPVMSTFNPFEPMDEPMDEGEQ